MLANIASSEFRAGRFLIFGPLRAGPTSTCVENGKPPAEAGDLVDQSVEGWRQRDFSASMRAGITL